MNRSLLDILCCPACRSSVHLEGETGDDVIETGILRCSGCGTVYPIVRGVPRFVPSENYATSFGFQWNRFPRTQLDSCSGQPISAKRFFGQSGWTPAEMQGRVVLDVGCGAGRFAEVALGAAARVVAIDYSSAVDACRANHVDQPRLDVVQADIYHLPFVDGAFDFVYCFGVLQHTPDVRSAFDALRAPLRTGGRIAVDLYPKLWRNVFWPKYWFRPLTKRISRERLFPLVERMVRLFLPVSSAVGRVPLIGRYLRWFVPVMNYEGVYPLDRRQVFEWSVLDTFDMYAPAHDHPQTAETLRRWMEEGGYQSIEVFRAGHLVGRGVKP